MASAKSVVASIERSPLTLLLLSQARWRHQPVQDAGEASIGRIPILRRRHISANIYLTFVRRSEDVLASPFQKNTCTTLLSHFSDTPQWLRDEVLARQWLV